MGLSVEWGGHPVETFLTQDLIVVSPGVDLAIEPIQKAMKKGIPVLSEIELAYRFIHVPIIAVTGTNGKTTTTLLIGEMLKEDGRRVGVGGNVGRAARSSLWTGRRDGRFWSLRSRAFNWRPSKPFGPGFPYS